MCKMSAINYYAGLLRGINENVRKTVWCLPLNRNSVVKSCYDDVDDGRREGKEGEKKEEKEKEEEERELAYLATVTFSHQNIKSV